ncbi:MAG: hypothetical protein EON54_00620 [Alcaligenaceae bacterium]|nr:MAG: hypothetical protein EON54_00620 [Alcaligenaceae bacterium]
MKHTHAQVGNAACCITVGIEPLMQRWGVDIPRTGPPQCSGAPLDAGIGCKQKCIEAHADNNPRANSPVHFSKQVKALAGSERVGSVGAIER